MTFLAYGDLHTIMRDQEIEIRERNRILKRLEEQEKVPNQSLGEWCAEDEPFVI